MARSAASAAASDESGGAETGEGGYTVPRPCVRGWPCCAVHPRCAVTQGAEHGPAVARPALRRRSAATARAPLGVDLVCSATQATSRRGRREGHHLKRRPGVCSRFRVPEGHRWPRFRPHTGCARERDSTLLPRGRGAEATDQTAPRPVGPECRVGWGNRRKEARSYWNRKMGGEESGAKRTGAGGGKSHSSLRMVVMRFILVFRSAVCLAS